MTATKICKVCGKKYEYCRTQRTVEGVFRWQDVACCPKHGSEYLAAIKASRGESDVVTSADAGVQKRTRRKTTAQPVVAEVSDAVVKEGSDD